MTNTINIGHAKYLDSAAIAAVEGEATLDLTGAVTVVKAGTPLVVKDTTDSTPVEVMQIHGDRATMADDDQIEVGFYQSNSAGTQTRTAKIDVVMQDVTAGSEDSQISFSALRDGVELRYMSFGSASPGGPRKVQMNPGSVDTDITFQSDNNALMLISDGGLDVVAVGGAAITGQTLTVYGGLFSDVDSTRDIGSAAVKWANAYVDAYIVSQTNTITAFATGGQASATALTTAYNEVTVVGTGGDSVKLLTARDGLKQVVVNKSANALDVFPNTSDTLNGGTVNVAESLAAGATITYVASDATDWVSY